MVGGNYRFTDSERIYAMKYMEVLLARNHEISGQAMGVALHNKVGRWFVFYCQLL